MGMGSRRGRSVLLALGLALALGCEALEGRQFPPNIEPRDPPAYCRRALPDYAPHASLPSITLAGSRVQYVEAGSAYVDPGASAVDAEDGDVSAAIEVRGLESLDTSHDGDHWVSYAATDGDGQSDVPSVRLVRVGQAPRLTQRPLAETGAPLDYIEHLPLDYGRDEAARYPLLVNFHGWGHSKNFGDGTLDVMDEVSLVQVLRGDRWDESRPFIVLLPQQCWSDVDPPDIEFEHSFLQWAQRVYSIDPNRIYITGLSAGGWAAWEYMRMYPNEVAAAAPMAAGGRRDQGQACGYKDVPVWGFHAIDDDAVPFQDMAATIEELRRCDPPPAEPPRLTAYETGGHIIDDDTFDLSGLGQGSPDYDRYDVDIYSWLLEHSLDQRSLP